MSRDEQRRMQHQERVHRSNLAQMWTYAAKFCANESHSCGVFDRDVNAARNMLFLLCETLGGRPRPEAFSRGRH